MTDEVKQDRRGTFWDWPVGLVLAGLVLFLLSATKGTGAGVLFSLLLAAFGVVVLLARRGSFSPRGR